MHLKEPDAPITNPWQGDWWSPYGIVREGRHKLIEFYDDGRFELYDLEDDLAESVDRSDELPETAGRLRKRLAEWRQAVDARMPTPNPNYDPTRANEWDHPRVGKSVPLKPWPFEAPRSGQPASVEE